MRDLDPRAADRLDLLGARSMVALADTVGDTHLHLDLRADNLLLRPDGHLIVVDWAWAARGAAWDDPALLAIECISSGEPALDADAWVARIDAGHGIAPALIVDRRVEGWASSSTPDGYRTRGGFRPSGHFNAPGRCVAGLAAEVG